jgi:hypothetical protein
MGTPNQPAATAVSNQKNAAPCQRRLIYKAGRALRPKAITSGE